MKSKLLSIALLFILVMTVFQVTALATGYEPPTSYGKPLNPGVVFNPEELDENPQGRWSFSISVNASDEIRDLLEADVGYEESDFYLSGYDSLNIYIEWDYKLDNQQWRSALPGYEEWVPDVGTSFDAENGYWATGIGCADYDFEEVFPDGILPGGKSYWDNHTMYFRTRFAVSFYNHDTGIPYEYRSPWSDVVSYSSSQPAEDPAKLINHKPTLVSAELKEYESGEPYLDMLADKAHSDIQKLNSISSERVFTNIWIRINNGVWKDMGSYMWMREKFILDASDYAAYFESESEDTEASTYEVKFRYEFDYADYPAAGKSGKIFSPFSNTISKGTPAYSAASSWAESYIREADERGILSDRLRGLDMTQPITREEFAEIAVLFYEMITGEMATTGNKVFLDSTNPEVLKAAHLDITAGVGDGTRFEPYSLLQRQQMATMIVKTLQACYDNIVIDISGQPDFKDQKNFAGWAIERAKFMAKYNISAGDGKGNFLPTATCTRQEAITFLVKSANLRDTYIYK